MKPTLIIWHNVETDGLPEETGRYLCRKKRYGGFDELPYSAEHKMFGVWDMDYTDISEHAIEVDYWAELPELN